MPRTTLNLDTSVLREVKRRARDQGKSIGDVISELVGPALAQKDRRGRHPEFRWRTAQMGPAKVDLEDKEAVRQALADR
ncbi:MAG TPA: hypothetical protein VGQ86_03115 [Candidatus Limnocylindria bacterium]|nr:hypothetical protein [Candidatus Limnocylindria bacterium]